MRDNIKEERDRKKMQKKATGNRSKTKLKKVGRFKTDSQTNGREQL